MPNKAKSKYSHKLKVNMDMVCLCCQKKSCDWDGGRRCIC